LLSQSTPGGRLYHRVVRLIDRIYGAPHGTGWRGCIGTDGVPEVIPNRHPIAAQSMRVRLVFGPIVPIALEDIGEIKNSGHTFKEAGAGKEAETVFVWRGSVHTPGIVANHMPASRCARF
jgi:hypothetical protein